MANLAQIIPALFVGPGGQQLTQEQIRERQMMAQDLLAQATDTSPNAGGVASILAKGLSGFRAGMDRNAANNALQANASTNQSLLAGLLGGLGVGSTGQAATLASPTVAPMQDVAPATGGQTVASLTAGGVDPVAEVLSNPNTTPAEKTAQIEYIRYANQGATRNQPLNDKLTSALGFLPELGVTAEVFSGGQPAKGSGLARVGSVRHDDGNAADVFFYKDGRRLDWGNDQDRPIFEEIVKRGRASGITGFGAGPGYMQQGSMHIGFGAPGVWGAGGRGANAPDWLRTAYGAQNSSPTQVAQRAPMPTYQQASSGVNPAIIAALSNPSANEQTRSVASLLLNNQLSQQQAAQELALKQQQRQQEIARRQQIAQQTGINPQYAMDDELWKGATGNVFAAPSTSTVNGAVIDNRTGQPIYQAPAQNFRQITGPDAAAIGLDPSKAYNVGPDGKIAPIGDSGVTVNNNMGGDKFGEEFAKLDAKALDTVATSGQAAQRNLGRINQLGELLKSSPTGFEGAVAQRAGEWGIPTKGLDTLQAAQAAINSLVPEQRQPGSGPMSDADLALFKQSLPRIINQPGGNELIINTMKSIAQYDAEGANIVQQLRSGKIDRAQAFEALQNRPNPLDTFKAPTDVTQPSQQPQAGWKDLGNGVKIRPKGSN